MSDVMQDMIYMSKIGHGSLSHESYNLKENIERLVISAVSNVSSETEQNLRMITITLKDLIVNAWPYSSDRVNEEKARLFGGIVMSQGGAFNHQVRFKDKSSFIEYEASIS